MKHKFNTLIVTVYGICEECKQQVESRKAISIAEMEQFRHSSKALREFKLELAYIDLDKHDCVP